MKDTYVILIAASVLMATYYLGIKLYKKVIEKRLATINELIVKNNEVVSTNKKILNTVELRAFQLKEDMLWMYGHYRDLLTVLQNVNPNDKETLMKATNITRKGMNIVAENFNGTFNCTPEQYLSNKVKMTYTNQLGQSYPAPNAGVN